MSKIRKLLFLIIRASFVLSFMRYVGCSQVERSRARTHNSFKHYTDEVSSELLSDIKIHGSLLWVSIGFLMPVGILAIRSSNKEESSQTRLKIVYYFHFSVQVVVVLVATAGAIMSIRNFDNSFSNSHQRVGLALYGVIWFQALIGFRRPKRGSKGRSLWYFFHWIFGTTICALGIFNIYTGLQAYHKRTSRSIKLWSILFTLEICVMGLIYLLQDKWGYMRKQGVILGTTPVSPSDLELPQNNHQKEVSTEPAVAARKSNSLGNYFAKSNALRKLFQLT